MQSLGWEGPSNPSSATPALARTPSTIPGCSALSSLALGRGPGAAKASPGQLCQALAQGAEGLQPWEAPGPPPDLLQQLHILLILILLLLGPELGQLCREGRLSGAGELQVLVLRAALQSPGPQPGLVLGSVQMQGQNLPLGPAECQEDSGSPSPACLDPTGCQLGLQPDKLPSV